MSTEAAGRQGGEGPGAAALVAGAEGEVVTGGHPLAGKVHLRQGGGGGGGVPPVGQMDCDRIHLVIAVIGERVCS